MGGEERERGEERKRKGGKRVSEGWRTAFRMLLQKSAYRGKQTNLKREKPFIITVGQHYLTSAIEQFNVLSGTLK